jgi:hypothetical protein
MVVCEIMNSIPIITISMKFFTEFLLQVRFQTMSKIQKGKRHPPIHFQSLSD